VINYHYAIGIYFTNLPYIGVSWVKNTRCRYVIAMELRIDNVKLYMRRVLFFGGDAGSYRLH